MSKKCNHRAIFLSLVAFLIVFFRKFEKKSQNVTVRVCTFCPHFVHMFDFWKTFCFLSKTRLKRGHLFFVQIFFFTPKIRILKNLVDPEIAKIPGKSTLLLESQGFPGNPIFPVSWRAGRFQLGYPDPKFLTNLKNGSS